MLSIPLCVQLEVGSARRLRFEVVVLDQAAQLRPGDVRLTRLDGVQHCTRLDGVVAAPRARALAGLG